MFQMRTWITGLNTKNIFLELDKNLITMSRKGNYTPSHMEETLRIGAEIQKAEEKKTEYEKLFELVKDEDYSVRFRKLHKKKIAPKGSVFMEVKLKSKFSNTSLVLHIKGGLDVEVLHLVCQQMRKKIQLSTGK